MEVAEIRYGLNMVLTTAIAQQLQETGLCVYPDYLTPQALFDVQEDFDHIRDSGDFSRAGTGQGEGRNIRDQVRRDEIHWLSRASANPIQSQLWENLDSLKQTLNRSLYLGLFDFEGHYASYPEGGFYRRHLDCFKKDDARFVTFVLYLNRDWKEKDGGRLRIYRDSSHVDIAPIGGTMVCFLSRDLEHEVMTSHASRHSFTGWFKRSKSESGG